MKIVMIGHKYVPSREGGVEIVVENLATRMTSEGHEVTILNRKRKEYPTIEEYHGCKVESVFTVNKRSLDAIVYAFFATLKARKMLKKKQADIVHFHDRTTKYIPNGVEPVTLREPDLITKQFGLTKNSYILFLARIVPEKGLHYLIDAWKLVKKQLPTDKKLVIAGGASHSEEYYNEIAEKVKGDDSILMTGFVQGRLLEELYSNAYLYVLPSDLEGMPMSLLEALSYGNVCLVSDIPENTEVINEDCYVFRRGNVDRLRHQIKKLINLNLNTHTNMIVPYSWDEVVQQTLEIYER